jgi:hypothetical protein
MMGYLLLGFWLMTWPTKSQDYSPREEQRKTRMNDLLGERFAAIQKALMAHHDGGTPMPNPVKGTERETFLRLFLQRVFPSHYRFTSGAIITPATKFRTTSLADFAPGGIE